jgi:hypothetical protein
MWYNTELLHHDLLNDFQDNQPNGSKAKNKTNLQKTIILIPIN